MKDITNTEKMDEMHQIKLLAAIGLYKTRSGELKKAIKNLKYGREKRAEEVREILDNALKEDLSLLIKQMLR